MNDAHQDPYAYSPDPYQPYPGQYPYPQDPSTTDYAAPPSPDPDQDTADPYASAYPADPYSADPYAAGPYAGDPYAAGAGQYPAEAYAPDPYQQVDPSAAPAADATATDPYGSEPYRSDPYGGDPYGTGPQPRIPEQAAGPDPTPPEPPSPASYDTGEFAFVEEEESADVIDWLKFAETRSERRDERRRRLRHRMVALGIVFVLALVGGVGYLWSTGRFPIGGSDSDGNTPAGAQKRDVIVLHLKEVDSDESTTALLVDNETTKSGTTVLLPNSLAVSTDDAGTTTLGKSVDDQGAGPTRDALSTLLGADIQGTWRLDTPFLELLVESVGGIGVDTDAEVKSTGKNPKTLVKKGENQELDGVAAVAYATYRGPGETQEPQMRRFGQVLDAVLKKLPSTAQAATQTVTSLGAVADPSLPDDELGATLAKLAEQAKIGHHTTTVLPVKSDGTLDEKTTESVIKDVLGGSVQNADPDATPRVSVKNASGSADAATSAQIALVNGGYTYVAGGAADAAAATSQVSYADSADAEAASEVAKTLNLPSNAVKKAKVPSNADIAVTLGQDYQG